MEARSLYRYYICLISVYMFLPTMRMLNSLFGLVNSMSLNVIPWLYCLSYDTSSDVMQWISIDRICMFYTNVLYQNKSLNWLPRSLYRYILNNFAVQCCGNLGCPQRCARLRRVSVSYMQFVIGCQSIIYNLKFKY